MGRGSFMELWGEGLIIKARSDLAGGKNRIIKVAL